MRLLSAALLLSFASWLHAAEPAPPAAEASRVFNVAGWVELDAEGRATAFALDDAAGLPAPLHAVAESQVRSLAFEPARVEGVAKPARSWFQGTLRLTPRGEDYAITLEKPFLGPRPLGRFVPRLAPPPPTLAAVLVRYRVGTDGKPADIAIEPLSPRQPSGASRTITDAVRAMRFEPETVDGQPVASEIRLPLQWGKEEGAVHDFDLPPLARDPGRPGAPGQDAYSPAQVITIVRRATRHFSF